LIEYYVVWWVRACVSGAWVGACLLEEEEEEDASVGVLQGGSHK